MISAIILTRNEEERIKACLESIKWVDEIILVDDGSTDKTLDIAKEYQAKIYSRDLDSYAKQKNFATSKASGDWLLYIDSDERVLAPLKEEIEKITSSPDPASAYAVSRRNIIYGQEEKYGPYFPDWVIRLIKKDQFKEWGGDVHEQPVFNGTLGYTKNSLIHLTHRGIDQIILKDLRWSKIDAKLRFEPGHPKMSSWRFLRILFTELYNQGIKRRGFFAGTVGTIDALMQTFSLVLSYIRLWEMQQGKSLNKQYEDLDKKLIEDGFKY